jgi:hypothetical protein
MAGKPQKEAARQVLSLRLSPAERAQLEEKAAKRGFSSSSGYIRDLIAKDRKRT